MSGDQTNYKPAFGFALGPYHRYFAWKPVDTFDRGWRWLCFVERRRIQKHDYLDGGSSRWWQYRAREVLKGTAR